jgi:hypothetical protein
LYEPVGLRRGGAERVPVRKRGRRLDPCRVVGPAPAGDERETMHPLLFVNWSAVSSMFRGLMWIAAIVLAAVIMVHLVPAAPEAHHAARLIR